MIIHCLHGTVVFFGSQDIGSARAILKDAPFFRQEDGLFFDEPGLFPPPSCECRTQAILALTEVTPQPLLNDKALVNNQAQAEASVCNAELELRFPDLISLNTTIRWLTELRDEFEKQILATNVKERS
jgi:hypothetical protein